MDVEGVDMSRAPSPGERAKRSAWATCLRPGDCVQARPALGAASRASSQWLIVLLRRKRSGGSCCALSPTRERAAQWSQQYGLGEGDGPPPHPIVSVEPSALPSPT